MTKFQETLYQSIQDSLREVKVYGSDVQPWREFRGGTILEGSCQVSKLLDGPEHSEELKRMMVRDIYKRLNHEINQEPKEKLRELYPLLREMLIVFGREPNQMILMKIQETVRDLDRML
jgi:hypothetical protein